MRRRQMRVKSGAVVIDLIQEHMAGVVRIMADVELAALDWATCCSVFFCPPIHFAGDDVAQSATSAQAIIDNF